jgi:hypothetical protein
MPIIPRWYLILRFIEQNSVYISPLSYLCYICLQSRVIWFSHSNNIRRRLQIKKLHSNIIPFFGTSFLLGKKKNSEAISVTGRGGP